MSKRIFFFFAIFLMLGCLISAVTIENPLPPLIRLHVLANSDSPQDQALKYMVRDKVIAVMNEKFQNSQSLEESREILLQNLPLLKETAKETLQAAGTNYEVQAEYGPSDFPTKYYGNFALPAGRYEAVRLVIGQGQGANWWCVLFPPLCLVSGQTDTTSAKSELAQEITAKLPQGKIVKVKPAFKVVEVWKEVVSKTATK